MDRYQELLLGNRAFVADKLAVHPDFFVRHAVSQQPEVLWIGCSDSRVPAEEVTGAQPGELFVHRNVANLVVHTDLNVLSVIQYAVDVLEVKHIIVCGHYNCGGVHNAMSRKDLGLLNKWLRHIKDVYRNNQSEFAGLTDPQDRADRLVELSVVQQVQNLAQTAIVQASWRRRKGPSIHGWVYDIRTGLLKELATLAPGATLNEIDTFDFDE
jgi:carbonic anhydrase